MFANSALLIITNRVRNVNDDVTKANVMKAIAENLRRIKRIHESFDNFVPDFITYYYVSSRAFIFVSFGGGHYRYYLTFTRIVRYIQYPIWRLATILCTFFVYPYREPNKIFTEPNELRTSYRSSNIIDNII